MSFVLRGWHVLGGLLAFFGVIIAVNTAFITVALRSFPGEDVRRSYTQGLSYNETLAARREQGELGWQVSAGLEQGRVIVEIVDREGVAIDGAAIEARLLWPANARLDQDLVFSQIAPGRYAAPVSGLQNGRWRLRGRAHSRTGARDFEAELIWR